MIDLFRIAVKEVFDDHFGLHTGECEKIPREKGYTALIPFKEENRQYEAAVWVEPALIDNLARLLLEDPDPDEKTREDLTSELANFIVGHAKMLASDRNIACTISTPRFSGLQEIEKERQSLAFQIDDACLILYIGEARG